MTHRITRTPIDWRLVIRSSSGHVLHASWIPLHEDAEQVAIDTINAMQAASERQEAEAA